MKENLLIVADSDRDANLLYAVNLFVPDPFIFLELRGRRYILMSDLEIDRARHSTTHCTVLSLNQLQRRLVQNGIPRPGFPEVIAFFLKEKKIRSIVVPHSFPIGLAQALKKHGISLKIRAGLFFPEREVKDTAEVKKISAALMMAEVGLAEGIQALKRSRIGKNRQLIFHNTPLTSEKLRCIIDTAILQAGGLANHTIVAGGIQGCDPHERGFGPLKANEPIILDVFPRSQKTGYFGDITRTVVKGKASETIRKMYATVSEGQEIAFKKMRPNTRTREVHQSVLDHFQENGFKTGRRRGRMEGFFHGTGHGLGLEIHEPPRLSLASPERLRAGQVVTIEPGLYYPAHGGVRLEDVALVTSGRARNLTKFEKHLEL